MTTIAVPDLAQRYTAWEYSAGAVAGRTSCPVCSATWQPQLVAVRPNGAEIRRLECWHDHDLHVRAGVGYTGARRDPTSRAHLTTKLANEVRVAQDVAEGRARILTTGRVAYAETPTVLGAAAAP